MAFMGIRMDILVKMDANILKMAGLEHNKIPMFKNDCGRTLSSHALMYIVKGCGYFEDALTKRIPVKPGSVFYLFPDRWHNFDPSPGTVWTEYWLLFDGDKAKQLFGNLIPTKQPFYQYGLSTSLKEAYENLYWTWFCKTRFSSEYSLYLLHSILAQVFLKINNVSPEIKGSAVTNAKAAIKRAIEHGLPFDFKEFAKQENVGYEKFRKEFTKASGLSPLNYLMCAKMCRAMELLSRPNLTVKEISMMLGFEDPFYFSRLFKRREGVSPENYRKGLLRNFRKAGLNMDS